jgi:hypothetical protein
VFSLRKKYSGMAGFSAQGANNITSGIRVLTLKA